MISGQTGCNLHRIKQQKIAVWVSLFGKNSVSDFCNSSRTYKNPTVFFDTSSRGDFNCEPEFLYLVWFVGKIIQENKAVVYARLYCAIN